MRPRHPRRSPAAVLLRLGAMAGLLVGGAIPVLANEPAQDLGSTKAQLRTIDKQTARSMRRAGSSAARVFARITKAVRRGRTAPEAGRDELLAALTEWHRTLAELHAQGGSDVVDAANAWIDAHPDQVDPVAGPPAEFALSDFSLLGTTLRGLADARDAAARNPNKKLGQALDALAERSIVVNIVSCPVDAIIGYDPATQVEPFVYFVPTALETISAGSDGVVRVRFTEEFVLDPPRREIRIECGIGAQRVVRTIDGAEALVEPRSGDDVIPFRSLQIDDLPPGPCRVRLVEIDTESGNERIADEKRITVPCGQRGSVEPPPGLVLLDNPNGGEVPTDLWAYIGSFTGKFDDDSSVFALPGQDGVVILDGTAADTEDGLAQPGVAMTMALPFHDPLAQDFERNKLLFGGPQVFSIANRFEGRWSAILSVDSLTGITDLVATEVDALGRARQALVVRPGRRLVQRFGPGGSQSILTGFQIPAEETGLVVGADEDPATGIVWYLFERQDAADESVLYYDDSDGTGLPLKGGDQRGAGARKVYVLGDLLITTHFVSGEIGVYLRGADDLFEFARMIPTGPVITVGAQVVDDAVTLVFGNGTNLRALRLSAADGSTLADVLLDEDDPTGMVHVTLSGAGDTDLIATSPTKILPPTPLADLLPAAFDR